MASDEDPVGVSGVPMHFAFALHTVGLQQAPFVLPMPYRWDVRDTELVMRWPFAFCASGDGRVDRR